MKKVFLLILGIVLIISCCGCKGSNEDYIYENENIEDLSDYFDDSLPEGTLSFTHSILNSQDFDRIIPLGQINPPGHAFPTDHIYFVTTGSQKPVYAPTFGKVLYINEPGPYGDRTIHIGVTNTYSYYIGHIFIVENLNVGDSVEAGEQIGVIGNTSCVDLGVLNKNIDNGFISPHLPPITIYGDKPLKYYVEPLKTQLYSLIKPAPSGEDQDYIYDKGVTDGEFAIDKAGTLQGNWYQEGGIRSGGLYDWDITLSFGYDVYYPDQVLIGSGKYYNAFATKNEDNPKKPDEVSVDSGIVTYYVYNANNTSKGVPTTGRFGILLVQMLSDTKIRLEIFEDTTSQSRNFTDASLYYTR